MDQALLEFWCNKYSDAIRKGQLSYDAIEVSLVFSGQLKLLNRIRKELGITVPVYLMKHRQVRRITTKWRIEF